MTETLKLIPFQPVPKLDFGSILIGAKCVYRELVLVNPTSKSLSVQFVESFREFSCSESSLVLEAGASLSVTFSSSPNEIGQFRRSVTIRVNGVFNASVIGFGVCVEKAKRARKRVQPRDDFGEVVTPLVRKRSLIHFDDDEEATPKLLRCGDENLASRPAETILRELNAEVAEREVCPLDQQEPALLSWLRFSLGSPLSDNAFRAERLFTSLRSHLSTTMRKNENFLRFANSAMDLRPKLEIRPNTYFTLDAGARDFVCELLTSYNPVWLRLAMEFVFPNCRIRRSAEDDAAGLKKAIASFVLDNAAIARKYAIANVSRAFKAGHKEAIAWHVLWHCLLIAQFLDLAKSTTNSPQLLQICLFSADGAAVKSTREFAERLAKQFLLTNPTAALKHLVSVSGFSFVCAQRPIEEFRLAEIDDLVGDLKDGVRLARLAEIFALGSGAKVNSSCIKCPALNVVQKIQNQKYALDLLEKTFPINLTGVDAKMIALGNRKQTFDLLWRLVFSVGIWNVVSIEDLVREILFLKRYNQSIHSKPTEQIEKQMLQNLLLQLDKDDDYAESKDEDFERSFNAESKLFTAGRINEGRWLLGLLFKWAYMVCDLHAVKIHNLTSSFSNGFALCCLVSHYRPDLVHCPSKKTDSSARAALSRFKDVNRAMAELGSMPCFQLKSRSECVDGCLPDQKCVVLLLAFLASRLLENQSEIRAARVIWNAWLGHKAKKCAEEVVDKQEWIIGGLTCAVKQNFRTCTSADQMDGAVRAAGQLARLTKPNDRDLVRKAAELARITRPNIYTRLIKVRRLQLSSKKAETAPRDQANFFVQSITAANETASKMESVSEASKALNRIAFREVHQTPNVAGLVNAIRSISANPAFAEISKILSDLVGQGKKTSNLNALISISIAFSNRRLPIKQLVESSKQIAGAIKFEALTTNFCLHMTAAKRLLSVIAGAMKFSISTDKSAIRLAKLSSFARSVVVENCSARVRASRDICHLLSTHIKIHDNFQKYQCAAAVVKQHSTTVQEKVKITRIEQISQLLTRRETNSEKFASISWLSLAITSCRESESAQQRLNADIEKIWRLRLLIAIRVNEKRIRDRSGHINRIYDAIKAAPTNPIRVGLVRELNESIVSRLLANGSQRELCQIATFSDLIGRRTVRKNEPGCGLGKALKSYLLCVRRIDELRSLRGLCVVAVSGERGRETPADSVEKLKTALMESIDTRSWSDRLIPDLSLCRKLGSIVSSNANPALRRMVQLQGVVCSGLVGKRVDIVQDACEGLFPVLGWSPSAVPLDSVGWLNTLLKQRRKTKGFMRRMSRCCSFSIMSENQLWSDGRIVLGSVRWLNTVLKQRRKMEEFQRRMSGCFDFSIWTANQPRSDGEISPDFGWIQPTALLESVRLLSEVLKQRLKTEEFLRHMSGCCGFAIQTANQLRSSVFYAESVRLLNSVLKQRLKTEGFLKRMSGCCGFSIQTADKLNSDIVRPLNDVLRQRRKTDRFLRRISGLCGSLSSFPGSTLTADQLNSAERFIPGLGCPSIAAHLDSIRSLNSVLDQVRKTERFLRRISGLCGSLSSFPGSTLTADQFRSTGRLHLAASKLTSVCLDFVALSANYTSTLRCLDAVRMQRHSFPRMLDYFELSPIWELNNDGQTVVDSGPDSIPELLCAVQFRVATCAAFDRFERLQRRAATIQRAFRRFQQRRLRRANAELQYTSLCSSSDSFSADPQETIGNRFGKAIKALKTAQQLYIVHRASGELDLATTWSSGCCEILAKSTESLDVLMDVLSNCNRSPNHEAIIECILSLLLNLCLCKQSLASLVHYVNRNIRSDSANAEDNCLLFLVCLLCRHAKNQQATALFCAIIGKLVRHAPHFAKCIQRNTYWFAKLTTLHRSAAKHTNLFKPILLEPEWSLKSNKNTIDTLKQAFAFMMKHLAHKTTKQ